MKVTQFGLIEGAAAATPPSGVVTIYAKTDNLLYWKDDTGLEQAFGSAVGGSVTSVGISGGTTGLTVTGSPITTSGTITLAGNTGRRVQSVSNAATITPDSDSYDNVDITAIAQAFTIANPTGTPVNFQKLIIRIKDNGTARAITWGSNYVAGGVALPTTTVLSKILNLGFIYNTANSLNKWKLLASSQEA